MMNELWIYNQSASLNEQLKLSINNSNTRKDNERNEINQ